MPYRVCKTLEIENGHMLSKHPDKCQFPHGHTRKVEFVLESEELDENEMVCDFKIIKQAVGEYIDSFDHAMCMNTDDSAYSEFKDRYGDRIIGFESKDPTTEFMAKFLFDSCNEKLEQYRLDESSKYNLRASAKLIKIRIWETSSSWAEYSAD